jgi:RHS repeat-associated protein
MQKTLTSENSEINGHSYELFRYYSPEEGIYISQDPIGLFGGLNLYAFVQDTNKCVDIFGLTGKSPNVTRGTDGQPLSANATVQPSDIGSGSSTNQSSRDFARGLGNSNDDAGHILGKNLGGQGGVDNVFPQNSTKNRGDYRTFERSVADYVRDNDCSVSMNWTFHYTDPDNPTRPTRIDVVVTDEEGNIIMQEGVDNPCKT